MKKIIILSIFIFNIIHAEYMYKFKTNNEFNTVSENNLSSCNEILNNGQSSGDGIYRISNNGKDYSVYCDMTSAGGGWTMIISQFETDPVNNWN